MHSTAYFAHYKRSPQSSAPVRPLLASRIQETAGHSAQFVLLAFNCNYDVVGARLTAKYLCLEIFTANPNRKKYLQRNKL